jgi:hypothetical protein
MTKQQKLVDTWNLCEFGVKTRVFNNYSQQMISYIISHPNYSDEQKIQDILDCIESHSRDVLHEITVMYEQIKG